MFLVIAMIADKKLSDLFKVIHVMSEIIKILSLDHPMQSPSFPHLNVLIHDVYTYWHISPGAWFHEFLY